MSGSFDRSLRTIETSRPRRTFPIFFLTLVLLVAWAAWFVAGRVAIYAPSVSARLEVASENHPVDAIVGGRVLKLHAVVGQHVRTGDVLLELDANLERLARDEKGALLVPTQTQVASLQQELEAEERGLESERHAADEARAESEAAKEKAAESLSLAQSEAQRLNDLESRQLISVQDAARARSTAVERKAEVQSSLHSAERIAHEFDTRVRDRQARIARLKHDISVIEGTRAEAMAATNRLGYDMEQRVVKAAVEGTIVDVTPLTAGSVVTPGRRICTIVPSGELKVVAQFAPAVALGRVREGQLSRLRLDGFPWTQYGTPTARVSKVAGEPNNGTIRVELALEPNEAARMIPLQHGLPAEVDVEVEQTSPAALVLRTVGAYTRLSAAER